MFESCSFFSQHLLTQFIHATTCGAASSNLAYTCLYYVLVVYCFDDEKRKDFFPLIEWKCYTWSLKKAFMVASLNSTIPFNLFCSAPCLVVNFRWIKQQIKCNQCDRLLYEASTSSISSHKTKCFDNRKIIDSSFRHFEYIYIYCILICCLWIDKYCFLRK